MHLGVNKKLNVGVTGAPRGDNDSRQCVSEMTLQPLGAPSLPRGLYLYYIPVRDVAYFFCFEYYENVLVNLYGNDK